MHCYYVTYAVKNYYYVVVVLVNAPLPQPPPQQPGVSAARVDGQRGSILENINAPADMPD